MSIEQEARGVAHLHHRIQAAEKRLDDQQSLLDVMTKMVLIHEAQHKATRHALIAIRKLIAVGVMTLGGIIFVALVWWFSLPWGEVVGGMGS